MNHNEKIKGAIALEDGRVFEGVSFGAEGIKTGEVVFNTGMTGYQEVITDPSYKGQVVTMTYPLIGNYGYNHRDEESAGPQLEGFITREYCPYPSNHESVGALGDYLRAHDVVALSEIDTRALTRHIRLAGAMRSAMAAGDHDVDELIQMAVDSPTLSERDLVSEVTCSQTYDFECDWGSPGGGSRVVLYDFGLKLNIARCLAAAGCKVRIVPATTPAEKILQMDPDGIMLSNGPGDPVAVGYAVEEIKKLIGIKPIFGICLGHQLLALALGARTYKLKFGHHGSNHPVKNVQTGQIGITSQNHGFCVDMDTLADDEIEVTHMNLNDQTVEGFRHKELPLMCVQHHPEAAPGPHDAQSLFGSFKKMMT